MTKLESGISVVLSTYREPVLFVKSAVASVLEQTVQPQEMIVIIDDISNVEVLEYLQTLASEDTRVIVRTHEIPQGLAVCRNEGIALATNKYVALMDGDDICEPERFQKQKTYLEEHNLDIVFSHVTYIDEEGNELGVFTPATKNPEQDIFRKHIFAHPTGFAKKEIFSLEKYDSQFKRAQDVDLWIRLLSQNVKFGIVPEKLLEYRVHRKKTPGERIERQSGYAEYGFKIAKKYFRTQYKNINYWFFALKWTYYSFIYTVTPKILLIQLIRLRDVFR